MRRLREQTNNQDHATRQQTGATMYDAERIIGAKFRALREEHGWTQADVSDRLAALGVPLHQTNVAKLEKGRRPLRVAEAFALAQVFGMPPAAVFYMPTDGLTVDMEYATMRLFELDSEARERRQELIEKIDAAIDYQAEVEYQRMTFINAVRSAGVEVDK